MFEISPATLKLAFRKLKSYYHYCYSSLFLKQKIIDFETEIKNGKISFEVVSDRLNGLVRDSLTSIRSNEIDYMLYPKKNSFRNSYGKTWIDDDRVNAFIDMDISFHLVDVLFSLMLFEKTESIINRYISFAGLCDERLMNLYSSNNFLFKNYRSSYKKWKSIPNYCHEKNPCEDLTIVKLDIKNCYPSIIFNIDDIFNRIGLENNNITRIMKSVFRLYSDKVFRDITKYKKEKNESCLPVGLLSSQILLNYVFSEIDTRISESGNVVLKYGRYADDILIVFKGIIKTPLCDLLVEIFNDIFSFNGETLTLIPNPMFRQELLINNQKSLVRHLHKDTNLEPTKDVFDFNNTSYIDYDDDERDNDIVSLDGIENLQEIRKRLILFSKSQKRKDKDAKSLFRKLTDVEILNSFPIWINAFKLFENDSEFDSELTERIKNAINDISGNDSIVQGVKTTLNAEFKQSYKLSKMTSVQCNYLLNVTLQDITDCIKNYLGKKPIELFPRTITIADISLFYATRKVGFYNFPLFLETIELYKAINGVQNTIYYDINGFEYSCDDFESTGLINISSAKSANKETEETRIALCALNMNKLEISSNLEDEEPKNYDLVDIENLIREAKRSGASYVLFPEFAITFDWIWPLVKVARDCGITLISGVTHRKMHSGTGVVNLTLLFEHRSGMVILKPKNYMSPEEIYIIEDVYKATCYVPKKPLYYIVNDGTLSYSFATCYEITNIVDRAKMADRINMLFLPVYNRDTNFFSSIIESFSRDASCFIGQANANYMGDTRLRQPTKHQTADIVKIKGGLNNYLVVAKLEQRHY